jgi:signal transduction histidine kinase
VKKKQQATRYSAIATAAALADSIATEDMPRHQMNDRLSADEALRLTRAQLWRLSAQHLSIQESERQRIAADLHEGLGQVLVMVKLSIEDAASSMDAGATAKIRNTLNGLSSQVKSALDDLHRISMNLRPASMDQLGIVATLSWFCREIELACPNMKLERDISVAEVDVPEPLKIAIFRIVQEAAGNILKHAVADRMKLSLTSTDGLLHLCVEDNGRGIDPGVAVNHSDVEHRNGLQSMRERAELSGGSYEFQSGSGQGTRISVWWPQVKAAAPECPVLPMKQVLARSLCRSAPDRNLPEEFSACLSCLRNSGNH